MFTISSDIWPPESSWPVASSSNHKGSTCYTHETIFDFNLETCPFSVWQFTWLSGWFEWTSVRRTFIWESLYRQSCLLFIFQGSFFTNPSQYCHRNLGSNTVIWTARVRTCARCLSEQYVLLCTLISSVYISINRFSPHIFMLRYPRHLLDAIQVLTIVKSSKSFLDLETAYVLLCLLLNRENSTRKSGISSWTTWALATGI